MTKRSDIKQEDIIKSAIEVFSRRGFEQASMEGISKQAGVSKRTLYKYYPNKDALFEVIVDRLMCRFDDQCNIEFDSAIAIDEQLTALTLKHMCYINTEEFQTTARLVMAECIRCPETSKVLSEKCQALGDSFSIQKWAQQGVEEGILDIADVSIAVEQYIGAIKAVVFWPQLIGHLPPPSCEELQQAVSHAVTNFVAAYQVN